jgi:hypothetical protein
MVWVIRHPANPRSHTIVDEIAAGAKAAVLHFAELAGLTKPGD